MSAVSLRDFINQIAICSEKAACIARHIRFMHSDFDKVIQEKQLDENHQHLDADYKTLADVIIQEVIKRDLRACYPMLDSRIYGEEDGSLVLPSTNEKIFVDVNGSRSDILSLLKKLFDRKSNESIEILVDILCSKPNLNLPNNSLAKIPEDYSIDLTKLGIWIDPIDGTQQYINGTDGIIDEQTGITLDGLPTALVLIGCFDIETGRPLIGVINRVFHQKINQSNWQGRIYWGTAYSNANFNNLSEMHCKERDCSRRVLLHGSVDVKTFTNLLNDWHKLEVSACGNKLLSIALKQANIYLVTKSAAYNWDLCAAHAIIRSIGGRIVDLPRLKAYFDQHRSLTNIDLSQFEIVYNDKLGNLQYFQPKDYACSPFIAYFNSSDLVDILEYFLINNILIE